MKRSIKTLCLLGILLLALLLCGAVDEKEIYQKNQTLCREMIDAILEDDYAAARSTMIAGIPDKDFKRLYDGLRSFWKNGEDYALVVQEQERGYEDGETYYRSVFKITFRNGAVYRVTCAIEPDGEKLAGFHTELVDISEVPDELPFPVQAAFLLYMLACVAFSIWMTVDCARRKINLKWLWIILCWVSAGFSLTVAPAGLNVMLRVGLVFFSSMATLRSGVFVLQLLLPIGAIIYFFRRKKLSAKAEREAAAFYGVQNLDFTVEATPSVSEESSDRQDPPAEE